jgi:hypothetical protein
MDKTKHKYKTRDLTHSAIAWKIPNNNPNHQHKFEPPKIQSNITNSTCTAIKPITKPKAPKFHMNPNFRT